MQSLIKIAKIPLSYGGTMQLLNFLIKYLLVLGAAVLLLGCSKLSQENFNKVKSNMTFKEVIVLLGNPTSVENITISGLSGTSAVWKDKHIEVDIQFLNDRMIVKSFNNINN